MSEPTTPVRTVLVTGAALGIGRAAAERFARRGDFVVATWHRQEPEPFPGIRYVRCDVTDTAAVDSMFDDLEASGHPVEVLVSNAAVLRDRALSRMTDDDFIESLDVNLTAGFRLARRASTSMASRRWGRMVFVSSAGAWRGNPGQANYIAAKMGLVGLARVLARELASRNVTANVVAPGLIDTELIRTFPDRWRTDWASLVPLGRFGSADEVASTIEYLASERASFVTGAVVAIDGGLLA